MCRLLTDMCVSSAELTLPKQRTKKTVPGWNDTIAPLRELARFWGKIWWDNKSPLGGLIAEIF